MDLRRAERKVQSRLTGIERANFWSQVHDMLFKYTRVSSTTFGCRLVFYVNFSCEAFDGTMWTARMWWSRSCIKPTTFLIASGAHSLPLSYIDWDSITKVIYMLYVCFFCSNRVDICAPWTGATFFLYKVSDIRVRSFCWACEVHEYGASVAQSSEQVRELLHGILLGWVFNRKMWKEIDNSLPNLLGQYS